MIRGAILEPNGAVRGVCILVCDRGLCSIVRGRPVCLGVVAAEQSKDGFPRFAAILVIPVPRFAVTCLVRVSAARMSGCAPSR